MKGCLNARKIDYKYRIYYRFDSNWKSIDKIILKNYTVGHQTKELTLYNSLFDFFEEIDFWRVYFDITVYNEFNQSVTGSTFMNFKVNKKPFNGSCHIDSLNGTAYYTVFQIECTDWLDSDGYITKYEYFGKLWLK